MWTRRATLAAGLQSATIAWLALMAGPGRADLRSRKLAGRLVIVDPDLPESRAFASAMDMAGASVLLLEHDPSDLLLALDEGWMSGALKEVSGMTRPVTFHLIAAVARSRHRFAGSGCMAASRCGSVSLHQWRIA